MEAARSVGPTAPHPGRPPEAGEGGGPDGVRPAAGAGGGRRRAGDADGGLPRLIFHHFAWTRVDGFR